MKEIILSSGNITLVSDEDYQYLNHWSWYLVKPKNSKTVYAARTNDKEHLYIHHEVLKRIGIYIPKGWETDHIDRNGLNNIRENLRVVTKSINSLNRNLHPKNTTGYKGVRYRKTDGLYEAYITVKKEHYWLGTYTTIEEAIQARKNAERRHL
jgi:hypothetical protein